VRPRPSGVRYTGGHETAAAAIRGGYDVCERGGVGYRTGADPDRIALAHGDTAKMAQAFKQGAAAVDGVEVVFRTVEGATADGNVLGTPVEWGNLTAEAKRFPGRVGGALGKAGATWGEGRRREVNQHPRPAKSA